MVIQPFDIAASLQLQHMVPVQAERIASWVRSAYEARMLAPRAVAPISAQTVLSWAAPNPNQFVLVAPSIQECVQPHLNLFFKAPSRILGYGELNELEPSRQCFWLGHLIIDPSRRGVGHGLQLTRLLLARAFEHCGAKRVTLVVFPENLTAVACYKRAGFEPDGFEYHRAADGTPIRLLRMAVDR